MQANITFDKTAMEFVLSAFGKSVNEEGFLVEANCPDQKVFSLSGEEIHKDDFAGIIKGSVLFIKSDLPSLIEASDRM